MKTEERTEEKKKIIYTMGYSQWTLERLEERVGKINGLLCDIRYQPRSRIGSWNQKPLQQRFGERYCHIVELGNVNYKSGPIRLANVEAGMDKLRELLSTTDYTLILMCVCRDARSCHRSFVADRIRQELDISPQELKAKGNSEGEEQLQLPL